MSYVETGSHVSGEGLDLGFNKAYTPPRTYARYLLAMRVATLFASFYYTATL